MNEKLTHWFDGLTDDSKLILKGLFPADLVVEVIDALEWNGQDHILDDVFEIDWKAFYKHVQDSEMCE